MIRSTALLIACITAVAPAAEPPKVLPVALQGKLHGVWRGGPCMGTLTLRADGTFERNHYSPGGNTLSGTWEVRWDALPPTLILTCTRSDSPDFVGQVSGVELTRLNDDTLAYQHPDSEHAATYTRVKK